MKDKYENIADNVIQPVDNCYFRNSIFSFSCMMQVFIPEPFMNLL